MAGRVWLFKSEPGAYSYSDLVRDKVAEWDGVRNYQARNFLRDEIQVEDRVLFYHSNTEPPAIIGIAIVVRPGYPDHTAWDHNSAHPDGKSTPDNPIWYMVDIKPQEHFSTPVTLPTMREVPELGDMMLLRKGMRLSVQPVESNHFEIICQMGRSVSS
jgi:predicted RNA-binding protein with PUA-like domain